ncbi:MAG: PIN domain-containing protein [Myxococcaceae bacterium]
MAAGVIDANIAIGWMVGNRRSATKIDRLFAASKSGRTRLILSTVNLAEVIRHTADLAKATGVDPLVLLRSVQVELHQPDEAVAYRAARLPISLGDSFAAATALELGARLHTSDRDLAGRLKTTRVALTVY